MDSGPLSGSKRKRICEELYQVLEEVLGPGTEELQLVLDLCEAQEINYETLCLMSEPELRDVLGITTFGKRRRLFVKLHQQASQIPAAAVTPAPAQHGFLLQGGAAALAPSALAAAATPAAINAGGEGTSSAAERHGQASSMDMDRRDAAGPSSSKGVSVSEPEISARNGSTRSNSPGKIVDMAAEVPHQQAPKAEPLDQQLFLQSSDALAADSDEDEGAGKRVSEQEREVEHQMIAEGVCVGACQWVAKQLSKALQTTRGWASKEVESARLAEIKQMEKKCKLPGMSVVVVGNTGAGKSSLLNAVIGETNALPTNGMRACTAVLAELAWADIGDDYYGEVEFLDKEEWTKEVDDCLEVLTAQDGRAVLNVSDPQAHNWNAWSKLWAVYGETYTLSRERCGFYADGRVQYRAITVQEMRAKLLSSNSHVMKRLGTVHTFCQHDVRLFRHEMERYVDSTNTDADGQMWPLVRMVRMRSGRWTALRTGARLVDAPGLRDDNRARDSVVKRYIKEADSIWVVSHVGRAVNDKTAKDMMGESFRRQLLMDGQMGNLVFVATQTDSMVKTEVADALGLDDAVEPHEVAAARNAFTRNRLQADFLDGLEEMAQQSGEWHPGTRGELAARFQLPVFTISAVDYQKLAGLRRTDGEPKVWRNEESTEIPALRRWLHAHTLARRRVNVRRQVEALVHFSNSIKASLELGEGNGAAEALAVRRKAVRVAFESSLSSVQRHLTQAVASFTGGLGAAFTGAVGSQLREGAEAASGEVLGIVRSWGGSWRGSGGLHWATYKATCRRDGEWKINMNEQMSEPVYRAVSTYWERAFISTLTEHVDALKTSAHHALDEFASELRTEVASRLGARSPLTPQQQVKIEPATAQQQDKGVKLEAGGTSDAAAAAAQVLQQIDGIWVAAQRSALARVAAALDDAKQHAQKQQRDINRLLPQEIKVQMQPGYAAAYAEAGSGSHDRRKMKVEAHVNSIRVDMFRTAIAPVLEGLTTLLGELGTKLQAGMSHALRDMQLSYSGLWEEVDDRRREARTALAPRVNGIRQEARRALLNLLTSQGVPLPDEFKVQEDEEIEIVDDAVPAAGNGVGGVSDEEEDDEEEAEFFRRMEARHAQVAAGGGADLKPRGAMVGSSAKAGHAKPRVQIMHSCVDVIEIEDD